MKRAVIALLLIVLAVGCGQPKIEYHFNTPPDEMNRIARQPALGHAKWRNEIIYIDGDMKWRNEIIYIDCDIWLLPYDLYIADACFIAVLKHEERHCYVGEFHAPGYIEEACKPLQKGGEII